MAKTINESGGSAVAVPGDMLNDDYINQLVKKTAEFGNGKIHIIVNNAGYTWDGVIHKVGWYYALGEIEAIQEEKKDCKRKEEKSIYTNQTPPLTLFLPDHGQAMGHNHSPAQHGALQTGPGSSPLLPRQRRRAAQRCQHFEHVGTARQRRPSKLRPGQSRRRRADKDDCQRMGPAVRRPRQHGRLWLHPDPVDGGKGTGRVCHDARWRKGCPRHPRRAKGCEGERPCCL